MSSNKNEAAMHMSEEAHKELMMKGEVLFDSATGQAAEDSTATDDNLDRRPATQQTTGLNRAARRRVVSDWEKKKKKRKQARKAFRA